MPVEYTLREDNIVCAVLLVVLLLTLLLVSALRPFFYRYLPLILVRGTRNGVPPLSASAERCQIALVIVTCVMYAIAYMQYKLSVGEALTAPPATMMAYLTALLVAFCIARYVITVIVNSTFFAKEQMRRYNLSCLLIVALEGVLLLPIVIVNTFVTTHYAVAQWYVLAVISIARIATIYQQRQIFFPRTTAIVPYFIYLCSVELAPFLALWHVADIVWRSCQQ